jgi:hypothetical protein
MKRILHAVEDASLSLRAAARVVAGINKGQSEKSDWPFAFGE